MSKKSNLNISPPSNMEATRNVRGFMHSLNEISQAFIEFAPKAPGLVIDMGVAYGVAIIPLLEKHIKVLACDIEEAHLDELTKRINPKFLPYLTLKQGCFPRDFDFKENSVGAILLSQILHFLNSEELDIAFEKLSKWLAPKGKVFIVTHGPYVAVMKNFIPIYEERLTQGIKWPYWLENNIRDYFTGPERVAKNLPATMNYLDLPLLTQALKSNDFVIEKAEYLDPKKNNIPEGLWLDGREWPGVIAVKKN